MCVWGGGDDRNRKQIKKDKVIKEKGPTPKTLRDTFSRKSEGLGVFTATSRLAPASISIWTRASSPAEQAYIRGVMPFRMPAGPGDKRADNRERRRARIRKMADGHGELMTHGLMDLISHFVLENSS